MMNPLVATLPSWLPTVWDSIAAALSSGRFWSGVCVGAFIVIGACVLHLRGRFRAKLITVSLPFGLGSISYEASSGDRVLAWKMYVQLKTRKAALPLDDAHDVVADVYASLYELFPVTRELLSGVPLTDVERPKGVADLILRTLNDGLRPHLTQWNAGFRRWWEQQLSDDSHKDKTPQDIQREYPRFNELVDDLKRTNTELSRFAEELLAIARVDRPKATARRPSPTPPTQATETKQIGKEKADVTECGVGPPTTQYNSTAAATPRSQSEEHPT